MHITVTLPDGSRMWVNHNHILKIVQTNDCHFIVHLINGEMFEVGYKEAKKIEEYFQDK